MTFPPWLIEWGDSRSRLGVVRLPFLEKRGETFAEIAIRRAKTLIAVLEGQSDFQSRGGERGRNALLCQAQAKRRCFEKLVCKPSAGGLKLLLRDNLGNEAD